MVNKPITVNVNINLDLDKFREVVRDMVIAELNKSVEDFVKKFDSLPPNELIRNASAEAIKAASE